MASWIEQLTILAKIAETEPQAAYAALVGGYKSKLKYFMRTIPEITEMLPLVEEIIRFKLILALIGGHQCSDECDLLSYCQLDMWGLNNISKFID